LNVSLTDSISNARLMPRRKGKNGSIYVYIQIRKPKITILGA
jgi:hypothetical protein